MATYWVRSTNGSDGNAGTSFAAAKQTLAAGLALLSTKNDILNVVNEADYAWPTSETALSAGNGTSWNDYGYLIRGVADASETPDCPHIAATGGDAVRSFIQMNSGSGYVILRNLIFDATAKESDASTYRVIRVNSPSGPHWLDGCAVLVRASGSTNSPGTRIPVVLQGGAADDNKFTYCLFQNLTGVVSSVSGALVSATYDHCIFYDDFVNSTSTHIVRTLATGTGDAFTVTNCTFYRSVGNNSSTTLISFGTSGTNAGVVNIHSNLVFIDSTAVSPNIEFLTDTGSTLPYTGTVGYNVLLGGPNVDVSDLNADGWYVGNTFDDGTDPKATDTAAYSQAEATVFNAPGSAYNWDALSNGATLPVPKDLRPRLYLTASLVGGVPGALPAAETDYSVTIVTDNTAPAPDDAVTLTVTVANDGTAATGVEVTAAVPAGLTLVLATPSAGSYDSGTGVWTVGSLADAASETLTLACTVDSDQGGNTITATATVTDGDPANDPDSSNDMDSVELAIVLDLADDPTETPYLDVAPIYAPVLRAEINATVRTKRNRVPHTEHRSDFEREPFREYTGRRITLGASSTIQIISSIERAYHLLIDATGEIEVSTSNSDTDSYFPAATKAALFNGSFTTLKLHNPSSTDSVDILLVVID